MAGAFTLGTGTWGEDGVGVGGFGELKELQEMTSN